jgi:crotonobetainyl-CoA:carnitine CoA-transferase CaiB-like acyl-CoA transferase
VTAALEGILVVSVEQAVAAPYCTMRLADAGARVIKIERTEGDFAREYDHVVHGESAYFVWINRGKESVVLDFTRRDDAALLRRMIARADVYVQNLAAGAAARAGFGSADLRKQYPRLITCDISGYGDDGPYRDMKAYDFLVQCETGLASVTGSANEPARVGISLADAACGLNAYAAILEALHERARTGVGSHIALALFDSLAEWMTVPLLQFEYGGRAPERAGLNHPSIAPYGAYPLAGGGQIVIAIQNEREWRAFCDGVLGQPALADDARFSSNSRRVASRPALDAIITARFHELTRDALVERLHNARTAFGSVNDVAGLSRHPQLRRVTADSPSGPVSLVSLPGRAQRASPQRVPALDEHGDAIRREFSA